MTRVTSSMKKLVEHRTVRYSIAISRILILLAVYGALVFIAVQCKTTCDAVPACNASASGDLSVVGVLSNITLNPGNTPSSTENTLISSVKKSSEINADEGKENIDNDYNKIETQTITPMNKGIQPVLTLKTSPMNMKKTDQISSNTDSEVMWTE